jgi:hypothetical protein
MAPPVSRSESVTWTQLAEEIVRRHNPADAFPGSPKEGPGTPAVDYYRYDSFTGDSTIIGHPWAPGAHVTTSGLRAVALLLIEGATGAIVWRFDFLSPVRHGTADGIVIGLPMGTIVVVTLIAVLACIIDLLIGIY